MTYKQAQQVYKIQGKITVLVWLRKNGNLDWRKPRLYSLKHASKNFVVSVQDFQQSSKPSMLKVKDNEEKQKRLEYDEETVCSFRAGNKISLPGVAR